ncbi:hypothetical protein MiSe_75310 [Microseira wollei NIES-4236]|uniref:eCIS core domain-containing protein n=2 Tax=Microseira wollei TaxID=467598 RepID=A0AAV3XJ80_9CYAN|nr:hypothetical protein MiSe_75310 [Microseira wollei NIES-4236]
MSFDRVNQSSSSTPAQRENSALSPERGLDLPSVSFSPQAIATRKSMTTAQWLQSAPILKTIQTLENEEATKSGEQEEQNASTIQTQSLEQPDSHENQQIQTKLTVGKPGDPYELEADSMAAKVMAMPDEALEQPIQRSSPQEEPIQTNSITSVESSLNEESDQSIQRSSQEEDAVQTKAESPVVFASGSEETENIRKSHNNTQSLETRLANSKSGGNPMSSDVRAFMEPRFGADFSDVKVHTDSNAVQMNRDLGAKAFAHGSDIYYGAGNSPAKDELTAHELTHTIQQTGKEKLNHHVPLKLKRAPGEKLLQTKTLPDNTQEASSQQPKAAKNAGAIARMGYLVEAAKQMPDHFMGQLSSEVMGMDMSQPLPFERTAADCACETKALAKGGDETAALLNKTEYTENDIAVDSVAPFDVEPKLIDSLNLNNGSEVEFGVSNDAANSMEAIKAELVGGQPKNGKTTETAGSCCDDEQSTEAKLQELMAQKVVFGGETQKQGQPAQTGDIPDSMKTIGPLTVGQRARYMAHQMVQGVKQWFSANWPKLLAGAAAALTAFIGLNILTGGAITAALPALMQVIGVVMGGVALANIAGHIRDYLSQGWEGEIPGAAKSLARGLAAGAVELVFALLFNAGAVIKALKGGFKGTAKAVKGAVKDGARTTAKSIQELGEIGIKGGKTALKNGKIILSGVKGGFAKGAKSIDELAGRLVNKLRFKKFKIRREGGRIQLWGEINPWILLADGTIEEVSFKGQGRKQIGDRIEHNGQEAIVVGIGNEESAIVKQLQQELAEFRNATYNAFGTKGLRNLATRAKKLPKTPQDWIQWAEENPNKVKGLNVQGIVQEYGDAYPEAVNKFLAGWFSGKYTRKLSDSGHVGDLSSLGIPKDVLENIANDSELKELALMLRPSNPAHATGTRQITLPKPGTATIEVPSGTSMRIKDIAKNAGPSPNQKTGFLEVNIKIDGEYKTFAFVEDNNGAIRLLPSEQATGLKPANLDQLKNNTDLIPLPEGNVTTSISSMYTPPVSTGLGDPDRGLVGTSLYAKNGQEVKYLAVSPDQGKTYYLEEAKKLFDKQGNLRTDLNVMVVGSDIDLLAVLSRNGELNNIADVNELASKHPEMFNALLEAFSTNRKNVNPLTKEGATFQFPSAASDIQHGPQVPFLADKLAQKATFIRGIKPEELKQMSRHKIQQYISQYRIEVGEESFRKEVEKMLGISDARTVLTIKGKNYTVPLRDVPMLYKLLGHEFPVQAYLPL